MTKYNFTSGGNNYQTPPEIYKPILEFIGQDKFDIDVCCSEPNITAQFYLTQQGLAHLDEDGNGFLSSPVLQSINPINGLTASWDIVIKHDTACWMNPPYNQCDKWVKKAYRETQKVNCEVWSIIPNRTETKYFHDYILNNPDSFRILLRKEWSFIDPKTGDYCRDKQGNKAVYKNPLCIVYFGKRAKEYTYRLRGEPILNGVVVE